MIIAQAVLTHLTPEPPERRLHSLLEAHGVDATTPSARSTRAPPSPWSRWPGVC